ncbi:MAG: DNA-binding NtrC family response regulator, partial [Myxococcota bacterium]
MRQVVVVEDDQAMRDFLVESIRALGFEVHAFSSAVAAIDHVRVHPVDTVLTDVRMPGMNGIELCKAVDALKPDLPVIVLTGFGSMDVAVEAMRANAYDFLSKPVELEPLEFAIKRAVEHHQLTSEIRAIRQVIPHYSYGMIGNSPAFQSLLAQIPKAARADVGVVIQGETGTGKELLARALHDASPRSDEPFVAINCAAIPSTLLESELFGHVRGAFTDARADRAGLFQQAGRGTLFLDEIGELEPAIQPKLLRAIQEKQVRAVGADRDRPVACRVIAATHADIQNPTPDNAFRRDLYYRLAVIRLQVPPLRERGSDILALAEHFVATAAERMSAPVTGISTQAARILLGYDWPGNVRELQNAMERAVAMADGVLIAP